MHALGFEPVLYVYYDDDSEDAIQGAMVDEVIDFDDAYEDESVLDIVQREGGILVCQNGRETDCDFEFENLELVEWVTPLTTYNRQEGAFASSGNEPSLNWVYGDVCMIVRIGKVGDRLAYPRVAQLKRVYRQRLFERYF